MDGKKQHPDVEREAPALVDGDDPDAPPSEEEIAASARLREALDDPKKTNVDADLLRAIAVAHTPRDIDEAEHKAIIARAVAEGIRRAAKKQRGVVIRVSFGVSAIVAIAASVLVFFNVRGPAPATMELAMTRSTQPLFPERFPQVGGESARIDRIAMSRSSDLRENRFARWGVR